MTFGSLFAGIGGFDLGLERAGMVCKWQVEIDPYARRVLEKHWPNVRRWDDVRTFPPDGEWGVDLICGGFPCQPVSNNGRHLVEADERWLWPHFFRVVSVLRPQFVVLENVPGLLSRGADEVFWDLAGIGYDAEWESIQAAAFGAPHKRERLFVVAYPDSFRREASEGIFSGGPDGRFLQPPNWGLLYRGTSGRVRMVPDGADNIVGYGIPFDLDGIRASGNAVVPQVAEWIGRRIMESANAG